MTTTSVELSELLEIQNGYAFKSSFFNNEGRGVPLIRIRDIQSTKTECYYDGDYREEFLVNPGDYIIGMDGDFICSKWAGEKALLNQRVCRLRNYSSGVSPEFIFFALRKELERIHRNTAFVTVKHISSKQISAIRIALPSLDEQRRIVGLLERADDIKKRCASGRNTARAIVPALFLDTFGDPATNPKGWQVTTLGEIIRFGPQNGLYRPASDYGEGTRIVRIDSFDDGVLIKQELLKRLRIDDRTIENFALQAGDIIINRVNSPPQLGKSVLVPRLAEAVVFESNMMRLRVDTSILLPSVLSVMLQLDQVRRALIKNAKHAINQSSINQGDVKALKIMVPPLEVQLTFVERAGRLEKFSQSIDGAAVKAEDMAAALAAEAFLG